MVPAVGEGAGPAFAVRLHQETGQVGNRGVHPCGSLLPPFPHGGIQRIGGGNAVAHGLGIVHGNHQPHAEGAEDPGQGGQVRQLVLQQQLGGIMHVDVVDAQHVQPGGGEQPSEFPHPGRVVREASAVEEQAAAGVSAFDFPVLVVPAVDHPQGVFRGGGEGSGDRFPAQGIQDQPVGRVEQAGAAAGQQVSAVLRLDAVRVPQFFFFLQFGPDSGQRVLQLKAGQFRGGIQSGGNVLFQPVQPAVHRYS